jgi:hypothetical protein
MPIIKNISEVQDYFPAGLSVDIKLISPVFPDVIDKYIKPFLSSVQLTLLETWYDNEKPEETDEDETVKYLEDLLPYVQRALVRFSVWLSIDPLNVKMTGSGFAVTSNQNLTPASTDRVSALKLSLENGAWDAIEILLRFLEENKDNYEAWAGSDSYTLATKNFVNSAVEFNKTVNISESRLTFYRMRTTMDRIEYLNIESAISKELSDAIKAEIISGEISEANQVILTLIKKAVIYYTAAEDIDKKYQGMADHYINDVKKIIDAAPDDYPEYRDSDIYVADSPTYPFYENSEDDTNFVFGSKQ